MNITIVYGKHKPLLNDDCEPYEFEFKPINGKMIRAFNLCCHCDALIEVGSTGACIDAPVETKREADRRFLDAQDRLEEDFEDDE